MQKKNSWITEFMSNFFMIFSLEIIFISVMGVFQNEEMVNYSTLYSLGSKGIAFSTVFQLFLNALLIAVLVKVFFSEKLFGNLMVLWRTVLLLLSIIVVIVVFIITFDWFPVNYLPGWIGFIISFGVCFAGSTAVMLVKTKIESKKYEELLEHYKENKKTEETDK